MALSKKYQDIINDIQKNLKNPEDFEFVKGKFLDLLMEFTDKTEKSKKQLIKKLKR